MGKYENLAYEIIEFCQKWNIWLDISIFAEGKRFTATSDLSKTYRGLSGVKVTKCANPEEYTTGLVPCEQYDGRYEYKEECFDNPEHLLEMTFEGPLYNVINYDDYGVPFEDWTEEAINYFIKSEEADAIKYYIALAYFEQELITETREGYDPVEFDSYEEYCELTEYEGPDYDCYKYELNDKREFANKEEYQDYLYQMFLVKEDAIEKYFDAYYDKHHKEFIYEVSSILDFLGFDRMIARVSLTISDVIFKELRKIFEKYGLYFDMCFEWSISAYKI